MWCRGQQGQDLSDLEAVGFEAIGFGWIVGEQGHRVSAQVAKDVGSHAVVTSIHLQVAGEVPGVVWM